MKLKVSLIVTTFNCKDNFQKTMLSIEHQDYGNIEVVIKDGLSEDGTLDEIRRYAADFRYPVVWKSTEDGGIYDAINQAYEMATGDVIGICNDLFTRNDAVSIMISKMMEEHTDGVHADLIYCTDTKVKRYWHMGNGRIQNGWLPGHPTLLLKKEVYDKYGLYKTDYKIAADYEFMCRMLKDGTVKLSYVPEILIRMYYGGTSTGSSASYWASIKEGVRALQSNQYHNAWGITFLRTCRVAKQFKELKKANEIWQSRTV